ncbi:MAG: hypothetical protein CL917_15635 [Deltaproteobacteria bacterium]|nr:hypothetical protein [Deltaproteobacteria bacterium]
MGLVLFAKGMMKALSRLNGLCLVVLLLMTSCHHEEKGTDTLGHSDSAPLAYPPNVILFSLDTLRADRLQAAPYISKMASEGFSSSRTWSSSNWTLPAHVSLLTSTNPIEHDFPRAGSRLPYADQNFSEELSTLAQAYLSAEYSTLASTGGGFLSPRFGFGRGFEHYFSESSTGQEDPFATQLQSVKSFLAEKKDQPIFMFIHTYSVHDYFLNSPLYHDLIDPISDQVHVEHGNWLDEIKKGLAPVDYVNRLYDAGIQRTDSFVREIVSQVELARPGEPLLVVITSDHGESFEDRPGLWHHGNGLWESQIRIPLVVWGNYEGAPQGVTHMPVSLIDVAPSLLFESGIEIPEGFQGQGDVFQISPIDPGPRDERLVRASRVHTGPSPKSSHVSQTLIKSGLKYYRQDSFEGKTRVEACFNLDDDPGETLNVLLEASRPCSHFPKMLSELLLQSPAYAIFLRASPQSKLEFSFSHPDVVKAVRTGAGSSLKIADLGLGKVSWTPASQDDLLMLILESEREANVDLLFDDGRGSSVSVSEIGPAEDPFRLATPSGEVTFFRKGRMSPAREATSPDPDFVRELRALGYVD